MINLTQNIIDKAVEIGRQMMAENNIDKILRIPVGRRGTAYIFGNPENLVEPSIVDVDGTEFYVSLWKK